MEHDRGKASKGFKASKPSNSNSGNTAALNTINHRVLNIVASHEGNLAIDGKSSVNVVVIEEQEGQEEVVTDANCNTFAILANLEEEAEADGNVLYAYAWKGVNFG
ncbi:unnamed protein product [Dovyalis caffra]|uniref:Uncharacterized protein n=1 Tax=Dovyalis caffra TaxID=77055 RepID=A0AAV1SIM1_9ROSI|nr:unnamed protein product [Dovyalis caffra]